jgi:hypothetical protein
MDRYELQTRSRAVTLIAVVVSAAAGCGSSTPSATVAKTDVPTGAAAVEAWLQAGSYKQWKCESAVHASRDPSPHGFNRICSNVQISGSASGTADWAVGASAVKELYASIDATVPVGYAVYSKTNAESAAGANWYWYERVPLDSTAPHDAAGVVANGMGGGGTAKTICVGCHNAAGLDTAHTPSVGGRDQVYTPVH